MWAAALALGASLTWGTSNFVAGVESRRRSVWTVTAVSQIAAALGAGVVLLFSGQVPPDLRHTLWPIVGGVASAVGIVAFYRALAIGAMSVVAPIIATDGVAPVAVGLLLGERPGAAAYVGMVLAVGGVALVSWSDRRGDGPRANRSAILLAVFTAVVFGIMLVGLDFGDRDSPYWTVFYTRIALPRTVVGGPLGRAQEGRAAPAAWYNRCSSERPDEEVTVSGRDVERRFRDALEEACARWAAADPVWRGAQAGCQVAEGRVLVPFFAVPHAVTHPGGEVTAGDEPVPTAVRILLLHYLLRADGTPLAHDWCVFRDLPDGMFYAQAFAERGEKPIAAAFGGPAEPAAEEGLGRFRAAAAALGGEPLKLADAAYAFQVLPRLPVAVLLWAGDDEFPARASIVFDSAAGHYLPAEDLAGIGGLLAGRLARKKG
jgi:uncharacterized membrane protein